MTDSSNMEYMGIPNVKVILQKKPFQYIAPLVDMDFSVSDFKRDFSDPSINEENAFFIDGISGGAAMVKPLFTHRSNFVEGSFSPIPENVAVPNGAPLETEEEMNRRVFVPTPTLHQRLQRQGYDITDADYRYPGDTESWDKNEKGDYNGPIWHSTPSKGEGNPFWIYQDSSGPNVEWFLTQKYGNFTNQSFWIEVHKKKMVTLDAEDVGGLEKGQANANSRHYRYKQQVKGYFAVRIGSQTPAGGFRDVRPCWNETPSIGPFDVVFPINGFPFIWDHSAMIGENDTGNDLRGSLMLFSGSAVSTMKTTDWILKDTEGSGESFFRLYFYFVKNRMIIKSSFSKTEWVFPDAAGSFPTYLANRYNNFFMPAGRISLMGRGFQFRMSYNPLEFDIYNNNGTLRVPSAKLTSRAIPERRDFPEGQVGGFVDLYQWKNSGGDINSVCEDCQCFFCLPNQNEGGNIEGEYESVGYGCDIISTPYEDPSISSITENSYTSMMIGTNAATPETGGLYYPDGLVWTRSRSPNSDEDALPEGEIGREYGFEYQILRRKAYNRYIEIGMNCAAPTVGLYTENTSARFASPIVWRIRAKHLVPNPIVTDELDITPFVKKMSYDSTASGLDDVRQTFNIEILIPKEGQIGSGNEYPQVDSRQELLNWLNTRRLVKVYLGWRFNSQNDPATEDPPEIFSDPLNTSHRLLVFSGLSESSPITQRYESDVVKMKCTDLIQILEDQPIMNSPFFDGMNIEDAFKHICILNGLPEEMFAVQSLSAKDEVIGIGYTFLDPVKRFDNNTPIYDAIQNISKMFWHVLRTNPDGTIVLTDLNSTGKNPEESGRHAVIDELDLTHDSFVFYADGLEAPNPYQRLYESYTVDRNFKENYSNLEVMTVSKESGAWIMDFETWDVRSVEDPDSNDFIGYRKPMRLFEPAIGGKEETKKLSKNLERHVFQPAIKINFSTFGRPALRVYDIIKVVFPDYDTNSQYRIPNDASGGQDPVGEIKMRVLAISGSIDFTSDMKYTMDVVCEHK